MTRGVFFFYWVHIHILHALFILFPPNNAIVFLLLVQILHLPRPKDAQHTPQRRPIVLCRARCHCSVHCSGEPFQYPSDFQQPDIQICIVCVCWIGMYIGGVCDWGAVCGGDGVAGGVQFVAGRV